MKSTATKADKKRTTKEGKGNSTLAKPEITEGCRNIFVDELKEIYFAEKALMISIPIMIKKAATKELVDALTIHYDFTKEHIKRLEAIFCSIGESEIITKYEAMYGSIKPLEGEEE
jgi:ferritin-like metal-binding protein YciE